MEGVVSTCIGAIVHMGKEGGIADLKQSCVFSQGPEGSASAD